MTTGQIVLAIVLFDLFFVVPVVVFGLVAGFWKPLEEAHPAVEPGEDAVRRNFQSIRIDMMNLGYCVHLAVDAEHLHIEPALLLRLLRARTMSLPWEALRVEKHRKSMSKVRLGSHTLTLPRWAAEMVEGA